MFTLQIQFFLAPMCDYKLEKNLGKWVKKPGNPLSNKRKTKIS